MRTLASLLLIISIVLVPSCEQQDKGNKEDQVDIVATIGMIADIAQIVGGDHAKVTALMGPGIDPHLYKASAGDVSRLSNADIIFYNGLHLEAKMSEVLENRCRAAPKRSLLRTALIGQCCSHPPEYKGAYDPHVWFDVTLWKKAVGAVRDTLVEVDAKNAEDYQRNSGDYLAKLDKLHQYVQTQAARLAHNQRVLVTAHDAFNYFGKAYGFEVRGLQGISTATEAGAADIQALADFIAQVRIPAMFVETSVSPRNIEAVRAAVKSRGFDVKIGGQLFSDAMGAAGTPEGTYIGMIRHNIDTIVESLLPVE